MKRGAGARWCLSALSVVASNAALAAVNEWSSSGPQGGTVPSAQYVPQRPGVAVAIAGHAIYRTTDNGASWSTVYTGLVSDAVRVVVAADHPDRVFVVGNHQFPRRSDDGGVSFMAVTRFGSTGAMEVSGAMTRDGSVIYGGTEAGAVFRSADGGVTWERRSRGLPEIPNSFVRRIVIDPDDANRLYAVVQQQGSGLYVSNNAGGDWVRVPGVCDDHCNNIALDPSDSSRIIAAHAHTLYVSTNAGQQWTHAQSGQFTSIRFDPHVPGRVFALRYGNPAAVFRSENRGDSWTQIAAFFTGGEFDLSIDTARANHLMIAASDGVFVSENGGVDWQWRSNGVLGGDFVDLVATRDGTHRVLAAASPGPNGVHVRAAGGEGWSWLGSNAFYAATTFMGNYMRRVALDPSNQNVLYAGGYGGLFRSTDAGASWAKLAPMDQPAAICNAVQADPSDGRIIYAAMSQERLMKSTDSGASWSLITNGLPAEGIGRIAIDARNPQNLYVAAFSDSLTPVHRSVDGGANWIGASNGLAGAAVHKIEIDPDDGAVAYAATNRGVYRTSNAGQLWSPLAGTEYATDVAIDPVVTSNVVRTLPIGTNGFARSVDSGASWEIIRRNDMGLIRRLVLDPARPSNVIAAVDRHGAAEFEIAPDLAISMTQASAPASASGQLQFHVANQGAHAASAVRVEIALPAAAANATGSSSLGACERRTNTLVCGVGVLRASASSSITVTNFGGAREGDRVVATLSAHERDPASGNNEATGSITAPASSAPPNTGGGGGGGGTSGIALLIALAAVAAARQRRRVIDVYERTRRALH